MTNTTTIRTAGQIQNLKELAEVAERIDNSVTEVHLDSTELGFEADVIRHQGRLLGLDQNGRNRIYRKLGAPVRYLESHSADFQAAALNAHCARGNFGAKLVAAVNDDEILTISRGDLYTLPIPDVIRAVGEVLEDVCSSLSVTRISLDWEQLDVELVSPSKEITVRRGDIVRSGIHIIHQRYGNQATLIEAFHHRLVCLNGMTRRECPSEGIERTRKLPIELPNHRELQMDQVRRLTRRIWGGLESQLEAMRTTAASPVRVEDLLIRRLQQVRISTEKVMPRLLSAWREEGSEDTLYGAVNALTRVATHDPSLKERQRRTLASLAGILSFSTVHHICKRCWSVLVGEAGEEI